MWLITDAIPVFSSFQTLASVFKMIRTSLGCFYVIDIMYYDLAVDRNVLVLLSIMASLITLFGVSYYRARQAKLAQKKCLFHYLNAFVTFQLMDLKFPIIDYYFFVFDLVASYCLLFVAVRSFLEAYLCEPIFKGLSQLGDNVITALLVSLLINYCPIISSTLVFIFLLKLAFKFLRERQTLLLPSSASRRRLKVPLKRRNKLLQERP